MNTSSRILITLALIALVLAGCRSTKVVTVTEYRDSVRIEQHTDSVLIYARDSVFIRERGDTILVDKYHILYRDRIVRDTVLQSTNVETPVVTTVEVPTKYIPKWVRLLLIVNFIAACITLVRIYLKIKR